MTYSLMPITGQWVAVGATCAPLRPEWYPANDAMRLAHVLVPVAFLVTGLLIERVLWRVRRRALDSGSTDVPFWGRTWFGLTSALLLLALIVAVNVIGDGWITKNMCGDTIRYDYHWGLVVAWAVGPILIVLILANISGLLFGLERDRKMIMLLGAPFVLAASAISKYPSSYVEINSEEFRCHYGSWVNATHLAMRFSEMRHLALIETPWFKYRPDYRGKIKLKRRLVFTPVEGPPQEIFIGELVGVAEEELLSLAGRAGVDIEVRKHVRP